MNSSVSSSSNLLNNIKRDFKKYESSGQRTEPLEKVGNVETKYFKKYFLLTKIHTFSKVPPWIEIDFAKPKYFLKKIFCHSRFTGPFYQCAQLAVKLSVASVLPPCSWVSSALASVMTSLMTWWYWGLTFWRRRRQRRRLKRRKVERSNLVPD